MVDCAKKFSEAGGHVAKSTGRRGGKGGPPLCPTGKHGRIKAQETRKKSGGQPQVSPRATPMWLPWRGPPGRMGA